MESRCTWHESVAYCFFFFNDTATTEIYTLSLHDALPISLAGKPLGNLRGSQRAAAIARHHQITGRDGLDGPLRPVRQRDQGARCKALIVVPHHKREARGRRSGRAGGRCRLLPWRSHLPWRGELLDPLVLDCV